LQQIPPRASRVGTHKPPKRLGPEKISVARLPVTGSDVFGREEDLAFLDRAWANQDVNVVTIVAWAGVGKSTLVNHWLRGLATDHYRSAELIYGWSFYREGTSGDTSSADEFLNAALTWFGDPDPRVGTAWEKGERLAKLVADRRTLLVLDGLEPLQNPPGPQEGRVREPSLQALLRELAAFNKGLCVITTRIAIADIADYEPTSALRRNLEQLSSQAGAKLLRALGVKGNEAKLRSASEEVGGHCLALTLLGSYLNDAYNGDIRFRNEVSGRLARDVRQGVHAQRVMESYQKWFGEGPELAVLRMLGLFDRPADEKAIAALLESPAIAGLTESLTDLNQIERRTVITRLRRARLLAPEDPNNSGQLDAHPLVREYFGEQLRNQRTEAWKESNRRLYHYYRALAPELPETLRAMEPLFLAVICGCNAGLYREALHEVYIARIQRGDASFAAEVLGARGALLAALSHFFEQGRWGSLAKMIVDGDKLLPEDQVYVLMQAGLNLEATRDFSAEAQTCCQHMEALCRSLNRPRLLYLALIGQWHYSTATGTMSAAMQIANRAYSLAKEQSDPALMLGAYRALASTLYYLGNFESARDYATRGVQISRSGVQFPVEETDPPAVDCLTIMALCEWHFGEIDCSKSAMAEAISLAKELGNLVALAWATLTAGMLARLQNNPSEAESLASDLIELSTRRNLAVWLPAGNMHLGWARAALGDVPRGLSRIEETIQDFRRRGAVVFLPYSLALKAEVLHLAGRTSEALAAINEAEAVSDRSGVRCWSSELQRLRSVFLTAIGAKETKIEASFCEAIRIAKVQKSVLLERRAQETCAEYQKQKASASGTRRFRLRLC
jgi:tetratricopeptide (TPR) repeat protein